MAQEPAQASDNDVLYQPMQFSIRVRWLASTMTHLTMINFGSTSQQNLSLLSMWPLQDVAL